MRFRLLVGALLALTLIVAIPAAAQDGGLTEEEQALVMRVYNARVVQDHLASYREEMISTQSQEMSITMGGQTFPSTTVSTLERTGFVVRQEGVAYVAAEFKMDYSEDGFDGLIEFVLNGEARAIGGVLYVNLAYEEPGPDLPLLPDGWTIVDNPDAQEGPVGELELEDMLNAPVIVDDLELLLETVSEVELVSDVLEDGTPVDIISLHIDWQGLLAVWEDPEMGGMDPEMLAMLESALADDAHMDLAVVMDADDVPYFITVDTYAQAIGIDASAFSSDVSPGMTLDFVLESQREETYFDMNTPIEPVEVPIIPPTS
jgi:hypothetical protein